MADSFKKDINNLKRRFKGLKQEVQARVVATGSDQTHNINFKRRTNLQVSKNIGQPGETTLSSSNQNVPIDQESSSKGSI